MIKKTLLLFILLFIAIALSISLKKYTDNIHTYQPIKIYTYSKNNVYTDIKIFGITPLKRNIQIRKLNNNTWQSYYSFYKDIYIQADEANFKNIDSCCINIADKNYVYYFNKNISKQKTIFIFPQEIYSNDNVIKKIISIKHWYLYQILIKILFISLCIFLIFVYKKKICYLKNFIKAKIHSFSRKLRIFKEHIITKRIFFNNIIRNKQKSFKTNNYFSLIKNQIKSIRLFNNVYKNNVHDAKQILRTFKKKENILLLVLSIFSVFYIYKSILFVIAMDVNNEADGAWFYSFTNLLYYYKTIYIPNNVPPFLSTFYSPIYMMINVFFIRLFEIDLKTFDGVMTTHIIGRSISVISLLASMYVFYKMLKTNNIINKYATLGAFIFLLFQTYISVIYRPDSLRVLFVLIYLYLYLKYVLNNKAKFLYLSSFFLLIACLVKQDAAIFFMPSLMFLLINKRWKHLITYLSIIIIYLFIGLIILIKTPGIIDSFLNLTSIEGFSFKFFLRLTFPYLLMISPMLVFSTYILIKRSKTFNNLHLFLCLNFFISFFLILFMTMRVGGALHYFAPFEAIMLFTIIYYISKNGILNKLNKKTFTVYLIYLIFLILFKNYVFYASCSVLTKTPANNKEYLLKASNTANFIFDKLNNKGNNYIISYNQNMMVFTRGKLIIDWYLLMKYHDKKRFACVLKHEQFYWEHCRKYIVKYIQGGNVPYIVFDASPKNYMFVKQEYPEYYLFCKYLGFEIYKYK